MNKVELIGRITADPEIKYSQSGTALMAFNIAVTRNYKDANGNYQSDFITCKAFGGSAEYISKYIKKGNLMAVIGSIETGKYTNKEGKDVYTTDVKVEGVENLTPREQTQVQQPQPQVVDNRPQQRPNPQQYQQQSFQMNRDNQIVNDDGDLPF